MKTWLSLLLKLQKIRVLVTHKLQQISSRERQIPLMLSGRRMPIISRRGGATQQLGQQESAGILSNDTADSSWQQGQVQREGQAQLANNTAQGNAQQDYVNNIGAAQQTGGVVAQQNFDESTVWYQCWLRTGSFWASGRSGLAALNCTFQLSDRDFASQQANAQMGPGLRNQ